MKTETEKELFTHAAGAIRDAEKRLRETTAKAASAGSFDCVLLLSRWAKVLQALLTEAGEFGASEALPAHTTRRDETVLPADGPRAGRELANSTRLIKHPEYSRDADFLVKRARSRKSRVPYEHRAPAEVIFVVAEFLADWRSTKKLLAAEQILEACTKRIDRVVPYQVYVALGWMMQSGVVRRHGRSGYSVPSPDTIRAQVASAWDALSHQQGN